MLLRDKRLRQGSHAWPRHHDLQGSFSGFWTRSVIGQEGARHRLLRRVAAEIRSARGDLMGAALADGGKTLPESDPEVSEAVDFVEFYSATARYFQSMPDIEAEPRGIVVVVSP